MSGETETLYVEVGTEIKKENANKLYRLSFLVQVYADNKKALKSLEKIVKAEEKHLRKSRFPLAKDFSGCVKMWLEDTREIIKELLASNTVERYNKAKTDLEKHIATLQKELNTEERGADSVKNFFQSAKDKFKSIKNAVSEGIEQVRDLCVETESDSK